MSPNEQDLLVAALNSNQSGKGAGNKGKRGSPQNTNFSSNPASGQLDYSDDSPYLDFDPDGEFDDFSYGTSRMIGDLPPELHEKRKSIDGEDDDDDDVEEGDRKRHEGDEKGPKKPGRKPLTSEPTTVGISLCVIIQLTNIITRNAKPKTALPSVPSVSAKRSTSKIWKQRLMISKRPVRPQTTRTGFSRPKSNVCKSN